MFWYYRRLPGVQTPTGSDDLTSGKFVAWCAHRIRREMAVVGFDIAVLGEGHNRYIRYQRAAVGSSAAVDRADRKRSSRRQRAAAESGNPARLRLRSGSLRPLLLTGI